MQEYWNGYYTTNPFIKKTIRQFSDYTNTIKLFNSLVALGRIDAQEYQKKSEDLMKALAV